MSRPDSSCRIPGKPVRFRLRACRRPLVVRRPSSPAASPRVFPRIRGTFADGVAVPEYGVLVPWGITREVLFRLIPYEAFQRKDHWPTLRFTMFGVTRAYAFNFCGDGDGLRIVQFDGMTPRRRTFRRIGRVLIAALGRPNLVDCSLSGQQTWRFRDVVVEQVAMLRGRRSRAPEPSYQCHLLHIYRR